MSKQKKSVRQRSVEFPFYVYLKFFHDDRRKEIYAHYQPLTRKFLRFNDPTEKNTTAYLRPPQFEALEMYVFLKEVLNNKPLYEIFADWYHRREGFVNREATGVSSATKQISMFGPLEFEHRRP